MHAITLETERIRLKIITPEIIRNLFETHTEMSVKEALALDESGYEKYLNMYRQGMETHRISLLYFLLEKKETGEVIGECGFHTWNKAHKRAEVFYSLKYESDKREGYLSEVLPAVLDFGFTQMELHRIEALVADWNIPSVKLLLKNHFIKEGTLREHYLVDGVFEDSDCYALINKKP
ncbi:MAG: GNAT family N-acetyltransferase [Crocinitomicaceae bacterium]|nr:GNAT family N-acetyltransferase [Crocinitomicaceae bacterium]NGF75521.1 GNAT family N-acetyltransferase [Fluviicola sp. SGL-29]